jgi:flagellar basal body P-ring formation protein FlgA
MITNILLGAALLQGAAIDGKQVMVVLPANIEVRGIELVLGQVATVTGADEAILDRVREASLGHVPAPGYSRLLDSARVQAALRRLLPDVKVGLSGAQRCRVTPAVTTVSAARLLEEAGTPLRELFAHADARVTAAGDLVDLVVPQARGKLELRAELDGRRRQAGSWSIPVQIRIDGAVYRTVWTRWTVELWERRRVLSRDIAVGEVLSEADFELARVPVGTGPEQHALDPVAFGYASARRVLLKGDVVTDRDVQRKIVIRRGSQVDLTIRRGAVLVRAVATAGRDGRVGDRIPVKVEKTGKLLQVIVIGPETVSLRIK